MLTRINYFSLFISSHNYHCGYYANLKLSR